MLERLLAERDDKDGISFSDKLSLASETDTRAGNAIDSERALFSDWQTERVKKSYSKSAGGLQANSRVQTRNFKVYRW